MKLIATKFSQIELLDSFPLAKEHFNFAIKYLKLMAQHKIIESKYFTVSFGKSSHSTYPYIADEYKIQNKYNIYRPYVTNKTLMRVPNSTNYICIVDIFHNPEQIDFTFIDKCNHRVFDVCFSCGVPDYDIIKEYNFD